MRSKDIKSVITQMSMDHNAKVAKSLRNLSDNVGARLAESGVKPVVSPMAHSAKGKNGYSINLQHKAVAVRESTTAKKIASAHQDVAQRIGSKSIVTKMMGQ